MLLSPAQKITAAVASLKYSSTVLVCSLPEYNDTFRVVMHRCGLRWSEYDRHYVRALVAEINGAPLDRASEVAASLLKAGFPVNVDDTVAEKVKAASWEPEHLCWVLAIEGQFHLRWRGKNENLYARAKMLPGASYNADSKAVAVPALYFEEVSGFAEEHNFHFTTQAVALLEKARREYHRLVLPEIKMPAKQEKKKIIVMRMCDPRRFADIPRRNLSTTTELYPHQVKAVEKQLPLKVGALFMDMGTGKTRVAIELIARRQQRISKVVWFCPVSLKLTIAEEFTKHTRGENIFIFDDEITDYGIPPAFCYIVGIESMSSSDRVVLTVNKLIDEDTFVVVDESSYIKGHASKRTMRITEIAKRSRYRLLLTGTPLSQGVVDLYAQFKFLSPDILGFGSFYSFARKHLEYSEKYPGMIVGSHNVEQLAEKIAPYVYQVTKAECMDLPEKLYDQIYFSLTREQENEYERAKTEILMSVPDDRLDSLVIFRLFTALQQIVSGFYNRDGELTELPHRRIQFLQTAIASIPEDEKVVIWCKYVYSVEHIAHALSGAVLYYGAYNERERAEQLARFRSGARFLIATQSTGGHGLTINEAHYHIFYENEFKYSHRIQAEDRSYRIGQTQPVTYIDIISRSGIDRKIMQSLAKKEDVVKSFRRQVHCIKDIQI